MLAHRDGLQPNVAGTQDDLPVMFDGSRASLHKGDAASTHIVKPAITAVEDSVNNETFCIAMGPAKTSHERRGP